MSFAFDFLIKIKACLSMFSQGGARTGRLSIGDRIALNCAIADIQRVLHDSEFS